MAAKQKTIYCCSECGAETSNWAGKCPSCGAWNTLQEVPAALTAKREASRPVSQRKPKTLSELDMGAELRFSTQRLLGNE